MTTEKTDRKKRRFQVHVDHRLCDGCGVCLCYCKPMVFRISPELSGRGIFPAVPESPGACTGCGLCELGCPQLAIAVVEEFGEGGAK
jgi:2-oxoglutarate ferredoxin oxidoreductase subunit delta